MDKKELEKKVAGLLNVDAEYKELAFSQFKKKLSDFLEVGEAVKINTLGIFQMKEQLDRSDESGKVSSKDKILTLVFSPESKTSEDDSIFLNLELEEKPLDDSEFDEKVFQIGIDKPLITSKEDEKESDSLKKNISNSISVLINDSEKIKNFDLWEDHLKNKETKDFIDELEEGVEDQLIESESDDKLNEVEDALY
jgi:nucleoid DNA-binding protein